MNITIINHYAGSPYHGMEFRPYYFAKYWIKDGHKVTIIASSYSHLRKNQPKFSAFQMIKGEYIDDIKYIWIRGNTYMGNGLFRFINLFWFISLLSLTINRLIKKTDLIITSSTYPLDIYPALLLKKINKSCKFQTRIFSLDTY